MKTGEKVFVIVYRSGNDGLDYLCLKPNPEPNRNTDYYVITGGVENQESLEEAALREVQEEIGAKPITIINLHFQIEYIDHITSKKYIEHCFAVKISNQKLKLNEEHIDFMWVDNNIFVKTIWWDEAKRFELVQMIKSIQNHEI